MLLDVTCGLVQFYFFFLKKMLFILGCTKENWGLGGVISVDTVVLGSSLKLPEMNPILKQKVTFLPTDAWEDPFLVLFSRDNGKACTSLVQYSSLPRLTPTVGFICQKEEEKQRQTCLSFF